MLPLVSVVIPVYNSEKTVQKSLQSVVDQTYPNLEILIVDDGSTDGSKKEIEAFIDRHPSMEITYIYQENKGASAARNAGLRRAKGDYIALLDSDDVWDPQKTVLQLDAFQKNENIDFLATNRNGEKFGFFFGVNFGEITKITPQLMLHKNFLLTPTVLFKRAIMDEVGFFDENLTHSEDLNYFLRISFRFNCYLLNKSLVTTGFGKPSFGHSGLSRNIWAMEKGELGNISLAYKEKAIGFRNFLWLSAFSILKFGRRIAITTFRRT